MPKNKFLTNPRGCSTNHSTILNKLREVQLNYLIDDKYFEFSWYHNGFSSPIERKKANGYLEKEYGSRQILLGMNVSFQSQGPVFWKTLLALSIKSWSCKFPSSQNRWNASLFGLFENIWKLWRTKALIHLTSHIIIKFYHDFSSNFNALFCIKSEPPFSAHLWVF